MLQLTLLAALASCAEHDGTDGTDRPTDDLDSADDGTESAPIDPRLLPPVAIDLTDPAQHGVLDEPLAPPTRPVAPAGERPVHEIQLRTERGVVTVIAEEVGDLLITEGDIVVGRVDDLTSIPDGAVALAAITDLTRRWDGGIVPFVVDPGLSSTLIAQINGAINALQAVTPVRFVPRISEADFIVFTSSTDPGVSSSRVGRQGGRQEVQLDSLATQGTIVHELMHALGVFHEQSRVDRDGFVEVDETCMQPGRAFQFRKELDGTTRGPYDFASIMHYDSRSFCRLVEGSRTMCECLPLRRVSGPCANCTDFDGDGFAEAVTRTRTLSVEDINGVHHMYRPAFVSETLDRMGEAIASGDFDGDGYDDLAVGAPLEALTPSGPLSGAVFVYKGTVEGLVPWRLLTQQGLDLDERFDRFGAALAVQRVPGGDGLLVGAPGESVFALPGAGAVYEFRMDRSGTALVPEPAIRRGQAAGDAFGTAIAVENSSTGRIAALAIGAPGRDVGGTDAGAIHLEGPWLSDGGLRDVIEGATGQRLGTSVAWGRLAPVPGGVFTLAAGAPGHDLGSLADVGAVYLWYGALEGAGFPALRPWTFLLPSSISGGKVGETLALGDFDRDGRDDLAVGAPGAGAGAAYWYRGLNSNSTPPWAPVLVTRLDQGSLSPAVDGERFGAALAATDLDGDGDDDLLIGAPFDRNSAQVAAGAVFWFRADARSLIARSRLSQTSYLFGLDDERTSDGFGTALAPFASRGFRGVAIGAPGEDFGNTLEAGGAFTSIKVSWPFDGMVGLEFVHQGTHSVLSE